MANWIGRREEFWAAALRTKVRAGMGIFITVFTTFMIIRDAVLDPKYRRVFLLHYIPELSARTWLIIGLCAFLILVLESGYDKARRDKLAFQARYRTRLREHRAELMGAPVLTERIVDQRLIEGLNQTFEIKTLEH